MRATRDADMSLFSAEEIETLRHVAEALGSLWSRELRERFHSEKAWTETPPKAMISYEWALELSL